MGSSFTSDLRASAAVLRRHLWLPAVSFLVFTGPSALDTVALLLSGYDASCFGEFRPPAHCRSEGVAAAVATLVSFPLAIFSVGWVGTERIWFLRAYRDKRIGGSEAFTISWSFWGRYFVLGLLVALPLVIVGLIAFAADRLWLTLALVVPATLVVDFLLTFVTPALAFSTRRVGDAMALGWVMLREHWPASAPYVFVPPLVLLILGSQLPPSLLGPWPSLIMTAVGTLANLWFKGAVVAFYLRVFPGVPDTGAAQAPRSTPYPPGPPSWPGDAALR